MPRAADGDWGAGIYVQPNLTTRPRSIASVRTSFITNNHFAGLVVAGSDASIEATVVRDTKPRSRDGLFGRGVDIVPHPLNGARSSATLRASLVERNYGGGVSISGSDVSVEAAVVRDTFSVASDGTEGRGIGVQRNAITLAPAVAHIRASVVERSRDCGLFVMASEVTVEATVVRDTQPRETDGLAGSGIAIEQELVSSAPSIGNVFASVIERSRDFGVLVAASPVTIATTGVRDTTSTESDLPFGDGVAVFGVPATERISVSSSRIERSARAGLSNFGSIVSLRPVPL